MGNNGNNVKIDFKCSTHFLKEVDEVVSKISSNRSQLIRDSINHYLDHINKKDDLYSPTITQKDIIIKWSRRIGWIGGILWITTIIIGAVFRYVR